MSLSQEKSISTLLLNTAFPEDCFLLVSFSPRYPQSPDYGSICFSSNVSIKILLNSDYFLHGVTYYYFSNRRWLEKISSITRVTILIPIRRFSLIRSRETTDSLSSFFYLSEEYGQPGGLHFNFFSGSPDSARSCIAINTFYIDQILFI